MSNLVIAEAKSLKLQVNSKLTLLLKLILEEKQEKKFDYYFALKDLFS